MTWRDNLRGASSEDGFIIANGSGGGLIPQNTNWHDNYMNSFTENGIKIANLKDAVTQVSELPGTGDEGVLYYLTGPNPGMYYYEGNDWVLVGDGGVSDFNDLTNRPKLNDSAMTGNTNITNFTGTDGTAAGAQGLVPAPATTDADKFLKSDGTWATAGGGGGSATAVKTLTADDFNYPVDNPTSVALWLLPPGFYERGSLDSSQVRITASSYLGGGEVAFVGKEGSFGVPVFVYYFSSTATDGPTVCSWYSVLPSIGIAIFQGEICKAVDNLTSTSVEAPLSANQGRILDGRISALEARITALEGGSANQNSGSSEDPGMAEPDPGVIAPTVTCPFCGQETDAASTICQNCGADMTSTPYDPGEGGEPGPEIQPEEPTEEPVEG